MSDNPVLNVNRIDQQSLQVSQAQVSQTAKDNTTTVKADDAVKNKVQADTKIAAPQSESAVNRETNLKFQVDAKTHQVTVLIMDRASNKVISTIPPDKIKDVPPGDLLQYLA